jgi:hypothetical protein
VSRPPLHNCPIQVRNAEIEDRPVLWVLRGQTESIWISLYGLRWHICAFVRGLQPEKEAMQEAEFSTDTEEDDYQRVLMNSPALLVPIESTRASLRPNLQSIQLDDLLGIDGRVAES